MGSSRLSPANRGDRPRPALVDLCPAAMANRGPILERMLVPPPRSKFEECQILPFKLHDAGAPVGRPWTWKIRLSPTFTQPRLPAARAMRRAASFLAGIFSCG